MEFPFASAEIRWFASDKDELMELYMSFPETGMGIEESSRTDLYLKTGLVNTGVKVRQGNHEIKVKSAGDEHIEIGRIEQWVKWSTQEERNIVNTIDHRLLEEWVRTDKLRYKKNYRVLDQSSIKPTGAELFEEGCGVEFTSLRMDALGLEVYTLGFEAFSSSDRERENLELILKTLNVNSNTFLRELDSCGYPQFLKQIV